MRVIAKVVDMIKDELEGAENYAVYAMKWKQQYPKLAQRLNELASVEMQHVRALHTEAERLISDYRSEHGEPPEGMLAIWEYEHEKLLKESAGIKSMIEEFDA